MNFNDFVRNVKRKETPFYQALHSIARACIRADAPRVPDILKPVFRIAYEGRFVLSAVWRRIATLFYRHPLFQARCATIGRNVTIDSLPFIQGHVELHIGNDVYLGGNISVAAGRFLDRPKLIIKDRAELGWNTSVAVSREVVIEEDARISFDCRISDSDGHRREADLRARNAPLDPSDIRPVRICRHAWIGNGAHIMKGVTIGEGAIIGANSVVISDIPPYSIAMGNPAEVYFRNAGKPSQAAAPPPVSAPL